MHTPFKKASLVFILVIFTLSACNLPRGKSKSSDMAPIYTAAAQTQLAQLTQISQPPPTVKEQTPVPPPTATLQPGQTALPATQTAIPCDRAKFLEDVTYPDGTEVAPGTTFVKTWRLQNSGSCTWTSAYKIVFSKGEKMGVPDSVQLTSGTVAPGGKVDVSVTLKAPDMGGTYTGEWKLQNAANVVFGIGDDSKPFWTKIEVIVATGIVYDFIGKAEKAVWTSGVGNNPGASLVFGGADDDPNGVAKIKDKIQLETGATSGKVLLTVPRHADVGVISGVFPIYTVQSGDHLKARLGFMKNPDGACGNGKVKFQINYKEGDTLRTLQEWSKTCDGSFIRVDLDLTSLKGKPVQFVFVVKADGAFADDWAVWNSPRIEH